LIFNIDRANATPGASAARDPLTRPAGQPPSAVWRRHHRPPDGAHPVSARGPVRHPGRFRRPPRTRRGPRA